MLFYLKGSDNMPWQKGNDQVVRELLQEILNELKKNDTYTITINVKNLVSDENEVRKFAEKLVKMIESKENSL
jgi:formate dehydrogenase maturation protein FdhE